MFLKFLFWILVYCLVCWVLNVVGGSDAPGCEDCADWEKCRGGDVRCWWRG